MGRQGKYKAWHQLLEDLEGVAESYDPIRQSIERARIKAIIFEIRSAGEGNVPFRILAIPDIVNRRLWWNLPDVRAIARFRNV